MKFKIGDRVRLVDNGRFQPWDRNRFVEGAVSRIQTIYACFTYTVEEFFVLWDNPKYPNLISYMSYELDYPKEHTDFLDKMRDRLA